MSWRNRGCRKISDVDGCSIVKFPWWAKIRMIKRHILPIGANTVLNLLFGKGCWKDNSRLIAFKIPSLEHKRFASATHFTETSPRGANQLRAVVPRESNTHDAQGSPKWATNFFLPRRTATRSSLGRFGPGILSAGTRGWFVYIYSIHVCLYLFHTIYLLTLTYRGKSQKKFLNYMYIYNVSSSHNLACIKSMKLRIAKTWFP